MPEDYGFTKDQKNLICTRIKKWIDAIPSDWNWSESGISVTDKKIHEWEKGDIIYISGDHIKIFRMFCNRGKTEAKKIIAGTKYDYVYRKGDRNVIIFEYKYLPFAKENLVISDETGWKMEIKSYEGALRIYMRLTGKKLIDFENSVVNRKIYFDCGKLSNFW